MLCACHDKHNTHCGPLREDFAPPTASRGFGVTHRAQPMLTGTPGYTGCRARFTQSAQRSCLGVPGVPISIGCARCVTPKPREAVGGARASRRWAAVCVMLAVACTTHLWSSAASRAVPARHYKAPSVRVANLGKSCTGDKGYTRKQKIRAYIATQPESAAQPSWLKF